MKTRSTMPVNLPSQRRGNTLLMVAVFMVVLFGFASLSIDVGNVWVHRKAIHQAADAAAIAAVRDWAVGDPASEVIQVGTAFGQSNGLRDGEIVSVDPGVWIHATGTFVGPLASLPVPPGGVPAVRVIAQRNVRTPFWGVLSLGTRTSMTKTVSSVAVVAAAQAAANVLPWAACDTFVPSKCLTVTVQFKQGGETNACSDSGPMSGNFGQLTLPGGSGANWYRQNIITGYPYILRVGDCFPTDPGVSWGPTRQGIEGRIGDLPPYVCTSDSDPPPNNRLGIVPKVTTIDVSGKKETCITGFYVISLDGYDSITKTVRATFLEIFGGLEVDPNIPPSPGELSGVALVQ